MKFTRRLLLEPKPGCPWAEKMVLNPAMIADPADPGRLYMLFRATGPWLEARQPGRPLPYPIFLGFGESRDGGAHWEFDFRAVEDGPDKQPFGLKPQQCNMAVIRTADWKYVHFAGLPPLLFNLASDPDELRNLADDPAHLAKRLELGERLLAWRAEHLDQSLALSALTEDGIAGSYPQPAWRMW